MRIRTRTRANCLLRNDRPTRRRLSAYDNRTDYNTGAVSYRFTISKLTLTDVFSRTPNRSAFVRHRIMSDRPASTIYIPMIVRRGESGIVRKSKTVYFYFHTNLVGRNHLSNSGARGVR